MVVANGGPLPGQLARHEELVDPLKDTLTLDAALVGVVAGLVSVPVIAVPTSTGYGASFDGLAPLLSMLNSCAPGVSVVNIDNGFGAGHLAALTNCVAGTTG